MEWKDEFKAKWNGSESVGEFIEKYPIKRASAIAMASRLRAEGYPLKRFRRGVGRDRKRGEDKDFRAAVFVARKRGLTFDQLATLTGLSSQRIHQICKKGKE